MHVIPAVATGCPVIVKPADTTPLSCFKFLDLLYEAGLKKEYAQGILCDIPLAEKMAQDPRLGFFSFIGSAKVGWYLKSKLAPGVRCALEHGGSAPVIVDKSCDLDKTITPLIKGGFYHAGRLCLCTKSLRDKKFLKLVKCSRKKPKTYRFKSR